jgi:hypothetical protein
MLQNVAFMDSRPRGKDEGLRDALTPKAVVAALDAHIIGSRRRSARSPWRSATAGAASASATTFARK